MPKYIGLLSGTSMDAIDSVLLEFTPQSDVPHIIATSTYPWPRQIKEKAIKFCINNHCNIDELGVLDRELGEIFSQAVLRLLAQSKHNPESITAIGSHGQNIRHNPKASMPFSLQLGDPHTIAARTGIMTVADFRRSDIAYGGQGAPLAPKCHHMLFVSKAITRIIINIGGLANITILPENNTAPIIGFDTGPGNCLMDEWINLHLQKNFDKDGSFAAQGKVNKALLAHLLADPYFTSPPPKATGREYFNIDWLMTKIHALPLSELPPADIQATLLQLTAQSIIQAIKQQMGNNKNFEVYICGGGAHNTVLLKTLQISLTQKVNTTASLGVDPDWVEAVLFACLAKNTIDGKAGNLSSVTGAQQEIVLGGIYGFKPQLIN